MSNTSDIVEKLRIDKWLWQARFFKTRGLAAKQVSSGHVRVNGSRVGKPAYGVTPGDVLTFAQSREIRVVEVVALGTRRGPAPEAQALYLDRTEKPAPPPVAQADAPRFEGSGRPDKRQRRALVRLRRPGPE